MKRLIIIVIGITVIAAYVLSTQDAPSAVDTPLVEPRATAAGAPTHSHAAVDRVDHNPAVSLDAPATSNAENEAAVTTLLVVEASSGERLTHGSLVRSAFAAREELFMRKLRPRGLPKIFTDAIVDNTVFPETLSLDTDDVVLWVGSRGYAWTSHIVERSANNVVALEPAGDLVLHIDERASSCGEHNVDVFISRDHQLYATDSMDESITLDAGDGVTLEGLPIGDYNVTLRSSSTLDVGAVLAEQTLRIHASETTEVTLGDAARPSTEGALHITLALGEVRPNDVYITLYERVAGQLRIVGSDGDVEWDGGLDSSLLEHIAPCVTPGHYVLGLSEFGFWKDVEVVANETTHIPFDLTEAATIHATLENVEGSRFAQSIIWGYLSNDRSMATSARIGKDLSASWSCAPEPIWIRVIGGTTGSETLVISPHPHGETRVDIPCSPEHAVSAKVTVIPGANAPTPGTRDFDRNVTFEALGHDGHRHIAKIETVGGDGVSEERHHYSYWFDTPGTYRMTYPSSWTTRASINVTASATPSDDIVIRLD